MKLAWAVIALFCVRFLVEAWFYPGQDADLAWQSYLGNHILLTQHIPTHLGNETFTAPGAAWTPQEWLFSTAIAEAMRHARFGWMAIFSTACAVLALALVGLRARRRGASTVAVALVVGCTGFAMMQTFGVRAQITAWPLLAMLVLLLDMEGNALYFAIPLVAVWANLHASALLAPGLIGAWTFGTWVEDRRWTPRVERNVVVTAGSLVAVCATPLLWHLPLYALYLFGSPFKNSIAEWQPGDLIAQFNFAFGFLPLALGACWLGIAAPRERWRDGILFAVSIALAFMAIRNISLAAIVIAPMTAQRLSMLLPEHKRINAIFSEAVPQALLYVMTAAACVLIADSLLHMPEVSGLTLPKAAIGRIAQTPGNHRLFCEDFAWCSLALAEPNVRLFIDGRCDPYPLAVWKAYWAVQGLQTNWRSVLDGYSVDTVLARRDRPLAQALALRPEWRLSYRDWKYAVFVRSPERTAQR